MPQDKLEGDNYGPLKVLCEAVVEKAYGKHANIIRPTYIAGPGDFSDRFTYWPFRVAQGGEMIAPGTPDDPIQYIDVRDLADFVRLCAEKRIAGRYNLCTPPRWATMGKLLDESKRVTGADTKFKWASTEFLRSTRPSSPACGPARKFRSGRRRRARAWAMARWPRRGPRPRALKFRSLETTIRETLEWQKTRPAEKQKLRSGLSPEREKELLALLA